MSPRKYQLSIIASLLLALSGCDRAAPGLESESSYTKREEHSRVIVFVHGVLGSTATTWTNPETSSRFPALVAEGSSFDEADVFELAYPTPALKSSYDIDELTEHVRRTLDSEGVTKNYDEIVFVCHSMGGAITRAFLLKYSEVLEKVPMIYFYSTPTAGASIAAFASAFSDDPQFGDLAPIANNTYLGSQQSSWLASTAASHVRTFCAYETKPTYGVQIVTRESATNLCNQRLDPIDADHLEIVKPRGHKDASYLALELAYEETFGSREVVELTSSNLPSLLEGLQSKTKRLSYRIHEQVDIRPAIGASSQWFVQDLTFSPGGALIIGDRRLEIDVRGRFEAADPTRPVFISFAEQERIAASGTDGSAGSRGEAGSGHDGQDGKNGHAGGTGSDGGAGSPGLDGGEVRLAFRQLPSPFTVDLRGQNGGNGGDGGTGGQGGRGETGKPGKSGAFGCDKGGGDGGRGGSGGRGGQGGPAGVCGSGGELTVCAPPRLREGLIPLVQGSELAADHGVPGTGGPGGARGGGGGMGRGSGFCGGGRGGSDGPSGAAGSAPPPPVESCPPPVVEFCSN